MLRFSKSLVGGYTISVNCADGKARHLPLEKKAEMHASVKIPAWVDTAHTDFVWLLLIVIGRQKYGT